MSSEPAAAVLSTATEVGPGVQGVLIAELTDEELAVLDGLRADERLVVLPWLDTLSDDHRDVAMLTAFRSLVARGLATGPDDEAMQRALQEPGEDGRSTVRVTLEETVAALLLGRDAATRVVSCQRALHGVQDFLYLYETSDGETDLVLGELVVGTGLHRMFRVDGDLTSVLQGYLEPQAWGERVVDDVVVTAEVAAAGGAPAQLVDDLDTSSLHGEVMVLRAGAGAPVLLHAVFAGPGGVRTTSATGGGGEALVFRSRDRADRLRWVAEEVLA